MIKQIDYRSLEQVREEFDISYNTSYIFRGHSNDSFRNGTSWEIKSSFKRYFNNKEISFNTFIIKNLERNLFNSYLSGYSYKNSDRIAEAEFIERLYYLQHYGIPTCFVDFTKDPIIALYFALSGLKIPASRQYQDNRYISLGEERHVTVIQIDAVRLKEIFKIKDLTDPNFCWNYDDFSLEFMGFERLKMAIDLNPLNKIKSLDNFNLENQKGCFILFDNTETNEDKSLERILEEINRDHLKIDFTEPLIIKHNFYLENLQAPKGHNSIFSFVYEEKQITGKNLFNDIQGLKSDLLQLHNMW